MKENIGKTVLGKRFKKNIFNEDYSWTSEMERIIDIPGKITKYDENIKSYNIDFDIIGGNYLGSWWFNEEVINPQLMDDISYEVY